MINEPSRIYHGKKAAGVLPYCIKTKKFLIGLRSELCHVPLTWNLFGGAIDQGEDEIEAVLRELEEEISHNDFIDLKHVHLYEHGSFTYSSYIGIVDEEFEPLLNWEHIDHKWVSLEELKSEADLHFGLKVLADLGLLDEL